MMYDAAAIGTLLIGLGYVRAGAKPDRGRADERESTASHPRVRLAIASGRRTLAARLGPAVARPAGWR